VAPGQRWSPSGFVQNIIIIIFINILLHHLLVVVLILILMDDSKATSPMNLLQKSGLMHST